jgi:hypothetical protein
MSAPGWHSSKLVRASHVAKNLRTPSVCVHTSQGFGMFHALVSFLLQLRRPNALEQRLREGVRLDCHSIGHQLTLTMLLSIDVRGH